MNLIEKIIGYLWIIIIACLVIGFRVIQFFHPKLTETQVIIEYWYILVITIAIIVIPVSIGLYLQNKDLQKRKDDNEKS